MLRNTHYASKRIFILLNRKYVLDSEKHNYNTNYVANGSMQDRENLRWMHPRLSRLPLPLIGITIEVVLQRDPPDHQENGDSCKVCLPYKP